MTEEQKKIIKALAYRVKATPKDDPEYENTVRLFEKLKKKYNVKDEDLIDTKNYEFRDNIDFKSIMIQLIVRRLKARPDGNDEFCFHSYRIFNGKKELKNLYCFSINLTDDQHKYIIENYKALKELYLREFQELKNKQKQEIKLLKEAHKREQKAFAYAFLDKADLLSPSSGEPQNKDPGFSLHDIIKAAQQLDSIIFPQNMIKEPPQKQLQMGI